MTRADSGSRWFRRAEIVLAATVLIVAAVGLALFPVTTPVYVRTMVTVVGASEGTGLDESETLAIAESVRRFIVDPSAPVLPSTVNGKAAFDQAAVSHLVDVRTVLVPALILTIVLLAVSAAWLFIRVRLMQDRERAASVLRVAGRTLSGGTIVLAIVALIDFDGFFSVFHSLFFDAGTWVFPPNALLIRVFPREFWIAAGATWAGFILVEGLFLAACGRRMVFTKGADSV